MRRNNNQAGKKKNEMRKGKSAVEIDPWSTMGKEISKKYLGLD